MDTIRVTTVYLPLFIVMAEMLATIVFIIVYSIKHLICPYGQTKTKPRKGE